MRNKKWLLAAALASAMPVGLVTPPASAAQDAPSAAAFALSSSSSLYKDGCTVTAEPPVFVGIASNGLKRVRFRVPFTCAGNRSISFQHEAYDSDIGESSANDRLLRKTYGPYNVPANGASDAYYWDLLVKHWDGTADPYVELYHRARFRVASGGVQGSWSPWEYSPIVKFSV